MKTLRLDSYESYKLKTNGEVEIIRNNHFILVEINKEKEGDYIITVYSPYDKVKLSEY